MYMFPKFKFWKRLLEFQNFRACHRREIGKRREGMVFNYCFWFLFQKQLYKITCVHQD